jgi:N-methylhydantoinase A
MHAVQLARDFGIRRVVIPAAPGVFSATGLLLADVTYDRAQTVSASAQAGGATAERLDRVLQDLEAGVIAQAAVDGWTADQFVIERFADARYAGQSFELRVGVPERPLGVAEVALIRRAFDDEHRRTYGRAAVEEDVEIINLRVRARQARSASGEGAAWGAATVESARAGATTRLAFFGGSDGPVSTPVIGRADLGASPVAGPLIVEDPDATTIVPPGATAALGELGVIQIETGATR